MKRSLRTFLMATVLVGSLSLPALAQDAELQNMIDRVERMDRDIKALSLKVFRSGGSIDTSAAPTEAGDVVTGGEDINGPLGARLSVRLNELENQMRQMTGQIEEMAYRISQLNTRMDKLVGDVDYRLTALEGGTPVTPPSGNSDSSDTTATPIQTPNGVSGSTLAPPPGATSGQPGVLGTLNGSDLQATNTGPIPGSPADSAIANLAPADMYQQARQSLLGGDHGRAETMFKAFLEKYPEDKLTSNVRYWLGETYYVQGQYPQAAATFLEGYQKDERGAKAPDSLLKLGMSLRYLDKQKEACATFTKLRSDFPKLPAHLSKTLERERSAAKCS